MIKVCDFVSAGSLHLQNSIRRQRTQPISHFFTTKFAGAWAPLPYQSLRYQTLEANDTVPDVYLPQLPEWNKDSVDDAVVVDSSAAMPVDVVNAAGDDQLWIRRARFGAVARQLLPQR